MTQLRPSNTKRHRYLTATKPIVLAHQGDSVNAPANTRQAFELAAAHGVEALETDIHWTSDGVIVISHDATVDRMSNGSGLIRNMSYRELRELDFGYTFTTDGGESFPYRNRGVRIPTLREVLERFPDVCVNIDVKPKHPQSLKQLISEILACKAEDRILLASFHHGVLRRIREMNPRIATSASPVDTAFTKLYSWLHFPDRRQYLAEQVPLQIRGLQVVTKRFIEHIHHANRKVHVWTIDDEKTMKMLLDAGVDGIVTNDPALGIRVRDAFLDNLLKNE